MNTTKIELTHNFNGVKTVHKFPSEGFILTHSNIFKLNPTSDPRNMREVLSLIEARVNCGYSETRNITFIMSEITIESFQ